MAVSKNWIIVSVFIITLSIFFFGTSQVSAATFFFSPIEQKTGLGGEFAVEVLFNADGERINAIEGLLVFPRESLDVVRISDGNSIVNLWIEKPKETKSGIIFSGIIPGGFDGKREPLEVILKPGKLFSVVFRGREVGTGSMTLTETQALLNDGSGTQTQVSLLPFLFEIFNYQGKRIEPITDTDPPEQFLLEVDRSEEAFEGRYFLAFDTSDKASGIDHYEVCELTGFRNFGNVCDGRWTVAESPYVLKDQSLRSFIRVKAVDGAGNERIAELEPRFPQQRKYILVFAIAIAILLAIILIRRRRSVPD